MNGSLPESTFSTPAQGQKNGHGDAEHLLELLRTLADPIRLRIVRLLESAPQAHGGGSPAAGGGGGHVAGASAGSGLTVGELGEILKLPQSTVSRHLKTLADARMAEPRREGTSMYYRLAEAASRNASRQLRQLARSHLERDPVAKNDTHRLATILRKRESAAESFFGKHAPQWDQLRAQWFGDTFHLEGLLALMSPAWVVADIGTGTGAMLPVLAPHVARVIAVDPSPAMLKGARARVRELALDNVDIRQGAAEHLPIESAAVDVALLALILAYTADPAAVLAEVRRTLKPGGLVLIIDLQPHEVDLFREKLNHRWMGFPQEQLSAWLLATGFTAPRWHPLSTRQARSKESGLPVPDLFALRAEATP